MAQHPHDPACIFCKIVQGQIPSAKVLETDHALAFLDINPVNRGHVLLVPKAHHSTLSELSDEARNFTEVAPLGEASAWLDPLGRLVALGARHPADGDGEKDVGASTFVIHRGVVT